MDANMIDSNMIDSNMIDANTIGACADVYGSLHRQFKGELLRPGDGDYEEAFEFEAQDYRMFRTQQQFVRYMQARRAPEGTKTRHGRFLLLEEQYRASSRQALYSVGCRLRS